MPKPNVGAYVGRDATGRIVLDMTSVESPAATLRLTLDDPEAAMRLADQLAEHANDDDANRRAYPEYFHPSEAESAVFGPMFKRALDDAAGNVLHVRRGGAL